MGAGHDKWASVALGGFVEGITMSRQSCYGNKGALSGAKWALDVLSGRWNKRAEVISAPLLRDGAGLRCCGELDVVM